MKTLIGIILSAALSLRPGAAQVAPASVVEIELDNRVFYVRDVSDHPSLATDPNMKALVPARNFIAGVTLADVVAVNGKPAKGAYVDRAMIVQPTSSPRPGQAIADVSRFVTADIVLEILQFDGTPVGTIMAMGFGGGPPPPGAPLTGDNFTIVGGTGAFLGIRGQAGHVQLAARGASMIEDPANRRLHGGGRSRLALHLIPAFRPEIVATPSGPAVFHGSDFSPVTAANPARVGETLIALATGLGPTRPSLLPGTPFPRTPLAEVNSPVEATLNGKPADVVNKVGWPGTPDTYRLDIRVPEGTVAGMAALKVTAAFIEGPEVSIPIQ